MRTKNGIAGLEETTDRLGRYKRNAMQVKETLPKIGGLINHENAFITSVPGAAVEPPLPLSLLVHPRILGIAVLGNPVAPRTDCFPGLLQGVFTKRRKGEFIKQDIK